jgi:hypothetical protein
MNIEPTTPIERAAYLLMQHPLALMDLLEECIDADIIRINKITGMPFWEASGEDLID